MSSDKQIRTQIGEHIFRKRACLEYCYMDPEFCPLYNHPVGESGETSPLRIEIKRREDYEDSTKYPIDYGMKRVPYDQFPRATPEQYLFENMKTPDYSKTIPDWNEKIKNEHEEFSPFSCWGDGSGFERDIEPSNLVGPSGRMDSLYELDYYPISTSPLKLGDWNTWLDKFQKDNRFAQVSDLNAETILFPNVEDPWMFTEYVFKGVESGEVIVEPPLYDEETLELKNADKAISVAEIDDSQPFFPPGQREEYIAEVLEKYGLKAEDITKKNDNGDSIPAFVKSFRQVVNWDELNYYEERRKDGKFAVKDNGGKLYRVDVNVESVKWGEHGNVPPGTINMGAPAEWMDASKTAARIKPTYVAHIGTPYYASAYGVVYWHDKDAFIEEVTDYEYVDGTKPYYTYGVKENGPNGVKQNTPKSVRPNDKLGRDGAKQTNTYLPYGSLSHGGCEFLKGQLGSSGGECRCTAMDTLKDDDKELETLKEHFDFEACQGANVACPKFMQASEYPILADYEGVAYNKAQYNESVHGIYSGDDADQRLWADNVLNHSTGLPMADMFVVMGIGTTGRLGRPDIYNPTEVHVWYEAKFEVVYESTNPVRLNKQQSANDSFGRGIQVLRGTGKQTLNTYENSNAFRGDTVFFGDMDQMSFSRWFETPMFCAKSAYCNDTCGIAMKGGWDPAQRAGSSEGGCKYYRSAKTGGAYGHTGCPTTCVQKRAYEFQETMTTATPLILALGEMWLRMETKNREAYNKNPNNVYVFESVSVKTQKDDKGENIIVEEICKIWSRSDTLASDTGGVMVKEEKEVTEAVENNDGTKTNVKFKHKLFAKVFLPLEGDVQGFFWYQSMDNSGAAKDVWFCKCDPEFVSFERNTFIIDNEDKFIGGYHPQYKNYAKIGPEYIQEVESDSYRDAMGDIIGDVDYDGQPQAMNKKGYWTDASGDYVVTEESIGADTPIPDDQSRNEPGAPLTISFKKSNTEVNGETGEMTSPKTINCAVHANDPYWLMEEFAKATINPETNKREGRPMLEDPNGDDPYWAPPNIRNRWALPTMRLGAHCPKCDYYIAWKYHDMICPWCGERLEVITGDRGEGMDVGDSWSENASILRKFFKLNAIGKVQVWAPPGTCVPKDGYYWKNPSVVTNTLIRQIKYRLGEYKDNGWQMNQMSAAAEFTLGYPEQIGYFIPMPDFESETADKEETYSEIKWTGVSKEDRSRYASYNDISPEHPVPGMFYENDTQSEAVIVPYTDASSDGLKMITAAEITSLRNHIEPILAYSSETPYNNDYPSMRATFEKREEATAPRYMTKGHCRVPSVILAANDNGVDSHVQFWSGDYEWGTVREYYPPGLSWWWLNQVIGSKYSDLTGGYYHMDGKSPHSGGNRTVAKCAMFIHGILPLDKEILAAYAIVHPAGEPSKDPIGRGWNGHYHYDHYHAMTENHHGDGANRHLHGQAGTEGEYDSEGNYHDQPGGGKGFWERNRDPSFNDPKTQSIRPMDESDYYGWSKKSNKAKKYRSLVESNFTDVCTGLPGCRDVGFWTQYGIEKININSWNDPIYSYDKEVNAGLMYNQRCGGSSFKEDMKFQLIGLSPEKINGEETGYYNLRQNYDSDDIWQNISQEEFKEEEEKSLVEVEFHAGDGNRQNEVVADIIQYSSKFINEIYPEQMQSIPGYFDFGGYNSEQRLTNNIGIETKTTGGNYDKPIIIQSSSPSTISYKGTDDKTQAGNISRVFDITPLFKEHYNNRVDRRFYCKAGKTIDEVSSETFPSPRWEGVGAWEPAMREESEKWNSQEKSSFPGYWLNDDYSFPKLESDRSIPGLPSEGEKYEIAPKGISLLCTFLLPFTIKEGNEKYWICQGNEEGEVKSLDDWVNKRITTAEEVSSILKTMFGEEFSYTVASSSSVLIENSSTTAQVEVKELRGNCYGYFSIPTGVLSGIQDRVVSVTSCASGFHPAKLAQGVKWVTNSYVFETQFAIFDLCRAPLIDYERDYRFKAPTINCASCVCPNADCTTSGMTAGMWAEQHGSRFGDGQTACPGCGADLSGQPGAVKKDGDGQHSWYYQESFAENPFITGFEIDVEKETSFRVSCRNSERSSWTPLTSVTYDSATKKYEYTSQGKVFTSSSTPKSFAIPKANWSRARYIQIEVDPKETKEKISYTNLTRPNNFSVVAKGNFREMGLFDWAGLDAEVSTSKGTYKKRISVANLNDDDTELTFYFGTSFQEDEKVNKITVESNRYTSTVNKFRVYGFHYRESDLTMTGTALETSFLFSTKKSFYQMEEFPTQLLKVAIGKSDSGGIELTETDNKDDLCYNLSRKTVPAIGSDGKYENRETYVINSGNYFFDPNRNRIYLPTQGRCGTKVIPLAEFEAGLSKIKENISYYPSKVSIRYWTGSGEPVTLEAQAEYQGPSFQLEKDTITTIESEMPDNGMSAKMPDMKGNIARRPIPWVCYNHVPSTLNYSTQLITGGNFMVPNLASTTLGTTVDNDKFFVDQFGEYCRSVRGTCKTEVTFYGAPDQILSGTIWVKAPAYTTKKIDTGSNIVTLKERTGGIAGGCFIFKMVNKECKGRKTLAWSKPTIVVYAKERNPSDDF